MKEDKEADTDSAKRIRDAEWKVSQETVKRLREVDRLNRVMQNLRWDKHELLKKNAEMKIKLERMGVDYE